MRIQKVAEEKQKKRKENHQCRIFAVTPLSLKLQRIVRFQRLRSEYPQLAALFQWNSPLNETGLLPETSDSYDVHQMRLISNRKRKLSGLSHTLTKGPKSWSWSSLVLSVLYFVV